MDMTKVQDDDNKDGQGGSKRGAQHDHRKSNVIVVVHLQTCICIRIRRCLVRVAQHSMGYIARNMSTRH